MFKPSSRDVTLPALGPGREGSSLRLEVGGPRPAALAGEQGVIHGCSRNCRARAPLALRGGRARNTETIVCKRHVRSRGPYRGREAADKDHPPRRTCPPHWASSLISFIACDGRRTTGHTHVCDPESSDTRAHPCELKPVQIGAVGAQHLGRCPVPSVMGPSAPVPNALALVPTGPRLRGGGISTKAQCLSDSFLLPVTHLPRPERSTRHVTVGLLVVTGHCQARDESWGLQGWVGRPRPRVPWDRATCRCDPLSAPGLVSPPPPHAGSEPGPSPLESF